MKTNLFKKSISILAVMAMLSSGAAFAEEAVTVTEDTEATSGNTMLIAADADAGNTALIKEDAEVKFHTGFFHAEIKEVGENSITVDSYGEEFVLNIGEDTQYLDKDLMPIELSALKEGMFVTAIHLEMMTFSIPPQVPAVMLIASETLEALPLYAEVNEVTKNEDGSITFTTYDERYALTLTAETEIVPFKTRNILGLDNISKGDTLLFYTDILTASEPAQGTPAKVVVLEDVLEEATDVIEVVYTASDWAHEYIDTAFAYGYIGDNFNGSDFTVEISREKFCDIAYEVLSVNGVIETPFTEADAEETKLVVTPFTDTDNAKVIALKENGIINGKSETEFAPNDNITREEAATILNRMAVLAGIEVKATKDIAYVDDADISDWARESVYNMNTLGIMIGTDNGFEPASTYRVEESVTTLVRLASKLISEE